MLTLLSAFIASIAALSQVSASLNVPIRAKTGWVTIAAYWEVSGFEGVVALSIKV
jgi:uncharacterized membrane protein